MVAGKMLRRYIRKGKCNRCGQCCVNEDCEYLEMGEIATCLIHNSPDRPNKCKWFPEMPPIPRAFKDCGFYFLDTWENNKIVKYKVS